MKQFKVKFEQDSDEQSTCEGEDGQQIEIMSDIDEGALDPSRPSLGLSSWY